MHCGSAPSAAFCSRRVTASCPSGLRFLAARSPLPDCPSPAVFYFVSPPGHGLMATSSCGLWHIGPVQGARRHADSDDTALPDQPATAAFRGSLAVQRRDGLWLDGQRLMTGPSTAVLADDDGLWATTSRGTLARLRPREIERLGGAAGQGNVYGLHQTSTGAVWAASLGRGLLRFEDGVLTEQVTRPGSRPTPCGATAPTRGCRADASGRSAPRRVAGCGSGPKIAA